MLLLKSQEVYKTLFLQDRRCKCRIFYLILCLVYFGLTYYQYYYIRINFSIILFVFYLLHLSFVPFILLSSLLLDQLYFILYFIFILYTCFCFINILVLCQWIKTCMLYSYINNEYSPTSNMMEAINPSSSLQFGLYFFCDHIFTIDIKGSIFISASLTLSLSYRELAVYIAFSSSINWLKNWWEVLLIII